MPGPPRARGRLRCRDTGSRRGRDRGRRRSRSRSRVRGGRRRHHRLRRCLLGGVFARGRPRARKPPSSRPRLRRRRTGGAGTGLRPRRLRPGGRRRLRRRFGGALDAGRAVPAESIPRMFRRAAATSQEVSARELLALLAGVCLLVVVMHWPLALHLETTIPRDLGDPLAEAWQVAWDGHALADQPLHFFQSNQFWPFHDTLAFSDALVGYAPAGLLGSGPGAAVIRYDLLFLFTYALAFAGAYLLARELGLGPGGAAVAGVAFAFAPYRLGQDGHMQGISSGGVPPPPPPRPRRPPPPPPRRG